jgi:hypothetical protein
MSEMSAPMPRTTTGATTTDAFETAIRSFESGRVFVPIISRIFMNLLAQRVNNHDAVRRYPTLSMNGVSERCSLEIFD